MRGRGGFRQGAGRKGMWEHGETQTIRVPVALKEELITIGQKLDQGEGIIFGQTRLQLEELISQWEAKCEVNQGEEWEQVRQLLTEIKAVFAQREMRGKMRGQCHKQQMRHGQNCNFQESEAEMSC
jgi:hypothetical protein